MSEQEGNYESRLICPMQSTGQVGKSTVLSAIVEYYKSAHLSYKAVDADGEHRSLSTWHENTPLMPFKKKEDLLTILSSFGPEYAHLVDFPAQATSDILSGINDYNIISRFKEARIRITIILFANQDHAGLVAAADIYKTLGDAVDYLIVENPIKFGSTGFWRSKLGAQFSNAPKLTLPPIPDEMIYQLNQVSIKHGRILNFIQGADHMEGIEKIAFNAWKKEVFSSLDKASKILLPSIDNLSRIENLRSNL